MRSFAPNAIAINNVKVIDASALGAILFGERGADIVEKRLSDSLLIAPELLDYEIAHIAVKKWRRQEVTLPTLRTALAGRFEIMVTLLRVDVKSVFDLAVQTRLSGYDASYLWLAREYDAELVTLDQKLNTAFLSAIGR